MILHETDFPYYTFGNLSNQTGLRHFVTSSGDGAATDVNLRTLGGAGNRQRLAQTIGFSISKLTTGEQTHSLNITTVNSANAGRGNLDINTRIANTDALISNEPGICIMVLTADCVPILLYDPVARAVAAVHAGWRGTAGGIIGIVIERMKYEFDCTPENLLAAIGPCIGPCCFEVGEEVTSAFRNENGIVLRQSNWSRPHVDLTESNFRQLTATGIRAENIEMAHICTKCSNGQFFSHRRNQTLGRIGSGIVLV